MNAHVGSTPAMLYIPLVIIILIIITGRIPLDPIITTSTETGTLFSSKDSEINIIIQTIVDNIIININK